ncbi:hypothetical protein ACP3TM_13075 [Staphylococcus sp. IPLA37010]|uniref:Lipoprotein n=1 Tax=Staphylococcus equorum TaxID=246432 RepID=A0AAW7AHT7_9STAP|nr:hypothetical protein [Staphylococcus equorum]MDK9865687.1 hypothetical protein [Staphylococcus equorum]
MKKLFFMLLASFLVLAACGQEESKSEDKKEAKASDKESKKDDKKSDDNKEKSEDKSDDKSNEEVATQDETTEQPVQSQEQVNTQEQQPVQSQEQAPVVEKQPTQQAPVQQEPTDQEKAEANAKVAKEHGYTGLPNGDAHSDVPVGQIELPDKYKNEEETKSEYQNTVKPEEESDWVKGQDEWMNASESERTEIRKADAEKYGYEYDPSDYE